MRGYKTLVNREIKRFLNVYNQTLIAPIINSILYFAIFSVIFANRLDLSFNYKVFIIAGIVMMSVLQNSYANSQASMTTAKVLGFAVDFNLAPISSLTLTLAFLTGGVLRSFAISTISIFVFSLFTPLHFHSLLLIFSYLLIASCIFSLIGIIVGAVAKNFDSGASYNTYLIMPLTFLSGSFYSVKMLTPLWQKVILFNPVFYIIDGFRSGFLGMQDSPFNLYFQLLPLTLFVALLFFFAHILVRKHYFES